MTRPAVPTDIQKAAAAVYAQLGRGPDADEQTIAKALMARDERIATVIRVASSLVAEIRTMTPTVAERLDIDRLDAALAAIRTPTGA